MSYEKCKIGVAERLAGKPEGEYHMTINITDSKMKAVDMVTIHQVYRTYRDVETGVVFESESAHDALMYCEDAIHHSEEQEMFYIRTIHTTKKEEN